MYACSPELLQLLLRDDDARQRLETFTTLREEDERHRQRLFEHFRTSGQYNIRKVDEEFFIIEDATDEEAVFAVAGFSALADLPPVQKRDVRNPEYARQRICIAGSGHHYGAAVEGYQRLVWELFDAASSTTGGRKPEIHYGLASLAGHDTLQFASRYLTPATADARSIEIPSSVDPDHRLVMFAPKYVYTSDNVVKYWRRMESGARYQAVEPAIFRPGQLVEILGSLRGSYRRPTGKGSAQFDVLLLLTGIVLVDDMTPVLERLSTPTGYDRFDESGKYSSERPRKIRKRHIDVESEMPNVRSRMEKLSLGQSEEEASEGHTPMEGISS